MEEDCLKEIRCPSCQPDHPANSRSWNKYKKEKEILEVKHKKNMPFLKTRKIVWSYMGENTLQLHGGQINSTKRTNIELS